MTHLRQLLASLGLLLIAAVASGQGHGSEQGAGAGASSIYDENVDPLVQVLTHEGTGATLDVMQESVQRAKDLQDDLQGGVESALKSRSGAAGKLGKKLVEESKAVSAEYAKELSWLEKVKRFAQVVDVVSTLSKSAAYLGEGDREGAKHVLVDDFCKKVCAAGGATVLSFIPGVGSIGGAAAGEEGYKKYVKPWLDKREQELRVQAAKDAQKVWLPREVVIDRDGNVRVLSPDVYYDPKSGVLKRRSEAEQAKWEEEKRRQFFDGQKIDAIYRDYLAGKLPRGELDKALSDFKKRDPMKVWEPPKLEYNAQPEPGAAGTGGGGILDRVKPQQVTASRGDSSGTLTITFWNVGALANGYADATAVTRHANGVETSKGTFGGGPNGKFSFVVDGEKITGQLVGGKTVSLPLGTLPVQNPQAFDNWPEDL